jgi:uncharacterized membrane-anchored protein YjiN (DUF445 family)
VTLALGPLEAALDGADVVRLRRMKLVATGFLVAAAAVYAVTFASHGGGDGLLGFVRAGAEAAMVGGLADWFAVTALFRRPLGLPVPHTAIIARQKDEIATKLGAFVTANFLTSDLIARQLADADVVERVAEQLRTPATANRIGAEVAHAVAVALDLVDPDAVIDVVLDLARRDLGRRSYAPILGQVLARAIDGDAQRPLVDLVAAKARDYVINNRASLRPALKDYLSEQSFWAGVAATRGRTDRLIDYVIRELDDIGRDRHHPLRQRVDELLRTIAADLEGDRFTAARVDLAVRRLLDDERFSEPLHRFVEEATDSLRVTLADGAGPLASRVSELVQDLGRRVSEDEALRHTIEAGVRRVIVHAVRDYGDQFTVLIRRTVGGWDPRAAARRIEVAVGRDLQFIRINGTVVGAAAGLAIHALTVAL